MKPSLSTLLSFNGGYLDTAGYLALQGLFTAHVTGNFVTIGAALAFGTSGVIAKLLALPAFCLTIVAARLASFQLPEGWAPLPAMLNLKLVGHSECRAPDSSRVFPSDDSDDRHHDPDHD
jgi:uncharacterized membrane protein YoaK (UPF0700 family)